MSHLAKFEPSNMEELLKLSNWLAGSELVPDALKKKPANITVVLMAGAELGFSAMQSLASIDVIQGKPVLSAQGTVALCLRNSEICEYFRLIESTAEKCTYETKRKGSEPVRLSYTFREAQAAGTAGKDNYKRHPAAMLRARCGKYLAASVYPDLTKGLVTPEEAEEIATSQSLERTNSLPSTPALNEGSPVTQELKARLKARNSKPVDVEPEHDPVTGEVEEALAEPGAEG